MPSNPEKKHMGWRRSNKPIARAVVLIWMALLVLPGQPRAAMPDRAKWEQERGDYTYGDVREKEPERPKPEKKTAEESPKWSLDPQVRNVILIVLALGLLAFLVNVALIKPRKRDTATESLAYAVEVLEENLPEADVDPLVRQALEQGEFAMVIRLRYLRILQLLDGQGTIVWKREKTNRMYLDEMALNPKHAEFKELTLLFEAIRYGDRPLDRAGYERISPLFVRFINRLML